MPLGLQILLIYFILCFLKASKILNMKVVLNDTFKFVSERVKKDLDQTTISLQLPFPGTPCRFLKIDNFFDFS